MKKATPLFAMLLLFSACILISCPNPMVEWIMEGSGAKESEIPTLPVLTITGFSISKVFDGTNTVSGLGDLSFVGFLDDDTADVETSGVTATYALTLVGTHNIIFSGNFTMTGGTANPSAYTIVQPSGITGEITIYTPATAPNAPGLGAVTYNSVTLTAPTGGDALHGFIAGSLQYARSNAGETAVNDSTWQNELQFFGLSASSTYYFFARYGDDPLRNNMFSTPSPGLSITTSPPPAYAISLSPPGNHTFTTVVYGYGPQASHGVTVNNDGTLPTGALTIALSGTNAGSFSLSTTSLASIATAGNAGFAVEPNTGLSAGTYTATVTVSGGAGITAQSFDVSFTVDPPVITITTQPTATTSVIAGSINSSLSVVASVTGSATLNYQWFSNTTNSNVDGTPITGATSASFYIPTGLTAGTYFYYCVVSATGGAISVPSNVATVSATVPVITITTQPAATTNVAAGSISGSLSVTASVTGSATLNYQWFSNTTNSNVGGTPISGATSASFDIPTGLTAGTYYYFVEVSAPSAVVVRSNVARVFVSDIISLIGIEMVWVAGGTFELGRELGTAGSGDTDPVSTVTLTGFHIGKFPVTQAQFETVMEGNLNGISSTPSAHRAGGLRASFVAGLNTENFPVERVSWYDAIVFCNLLSIMEGLTPAYEMPNQWPNPASWSYDPDDWGVVPIWTNPSAIARWDNVRIRAGSNGYRLPTEAQWEYAAKGGNTGEQFTFSGSNDPAEVAWHGGNSGDRTHEVGGLAPNGLGIHDMSGNVYEWCWDWHAAYTAGVKTDPAGAGSGTDRVVRGGSRSAAAVLSRSVHRFQSYPDLRNNDGGFRVVRP